MNWCLKHTVKSLATFKKTDNLTYVEFGYEKEALFDHWCLVLKTETLSSQQTLSTLSIPVKSDLEVYAPFGMKSFVSLSEGDPKIPITILGDSGASQLIILKEVLPLSEKSSIKSNTLIQVSEMQTVGVPLHAIHLDCDLVKGCSVGVWAQFPHRRCVSHFGQRFGSG